jgi:hypothetical protein
MEIHENAPVVARSQVRIAADPDSVWELLTDLEKWPTWKSDVRSVALHGALKPGSIFVWKAGPRTIRSTLQEVDRPRAIGWTGATFGVKAIDVFRLEASDGGTLVSEAESWEGLVVRLFARRMRKTLQSSLDGGLAELKAEAERRVTARIRRQAEQERRAS